MRVGSGTVAVVTGASGGIGRATVRLLATRGGQIALLTRGADGIVLGFLAYLAGYFFILPPTGLSKELTKQRFPEVAGELLRHTIYGVATAASFGIIREAM